MKYLKNEEDCIEEFSDWLELKDLDSSCELKTSHHPEPTNVFGMYSRVQSETPYYRSKDNQWVRRLTCRIQSPEHCRGDGTIHSQCPWRGFALISGV